MNAPTAIPFTTATASRQVLLRFLWKEIRMLRGFWIGVGVLAALQMVATNALLNESARVPWLFASAWAAAALYAVGAAVTLFAVEREERTDAFLRLLPQYERSVYAGKLLAATASAFALALVLIFVARAVGGGLWPNRQTAAMLAITGAITIIEWLAWGVLASLLCPQPLLAAILAIGAACLGAQFAMVIRGDVRTEFTFAGYYAAIPQRLLVLTAVGALDSWLGLRWLRPRTSAPFRRRRSALKSVEAADNAAEPSVFSAAPSRRRMFTRLVWQSWREGWKAMLAVVPLGLLLMFADSMVSSMFLRKWGGFGAPPILTLLSIPALYGVLVFRADQRTRQYRFLTDHAARPAIVWAARQFAWLVPLLIVGFVLQSLAWIGVSYALNDAVVDALADSWGSYRTLIGGDPEAPIYTALAIERVGRVFAALRELVWCAALAAYGAGQLCSMLSRSNVLAGFAALAVAAVVSLWSIVVGLWDLPGLLFVAPLAAATLIASLLRTRPWLTERTGIRPWLAPAAAVAASIALVAFALAPVRRAQLDLPRLQYNFVRAPLQQTLRRWEADAPDAQAVALRYEQLAAEMPQSDAVRPELMRRYSDSRRNRVARQTSTSWALSPEQISHVFLRANQARFDELATISLANRCRLAPAVEGGRMATPLLVDYLAADATRHLEAGDLDKSFVRIITSRRILAHTAQYKPTLRFAGDRILPRDVQLLERWATAPKQSADRLLDAVQQLQHCEQMYPEASEGVVADYLAVRAVVRGEELPRFMQRGPKTSGPTWDHQHFAYLANQLPGEQARAEIALRRMTEARLDFADAVTNCLIPVGMGYREVDVAQSLRKTFYSRADWSDFAAALPSPAALGRFYNYHQVQLQQLTLEASKSSYLPTIELAYRSGLSGHLLEYLHNLASRRAERVRVALIAYQRKNGAYPKTLGELDAFVGREALMSYDAVPLDPFTGEMFEYRPEGFELPTAADGMTRANEFIPAGAPLLWSPGLYEGPEPHEAWVAEVRGFEGAIQLEWTTAPRPGYTDPDLNGATPTQVMRLGATALTELPAPPSPSR